MPSAHKRQSPRQRPPRSLQAKPTACRRLCTYVFPPSTSLSTIVNKIRIQPKLETLSSFNAQAKFQVAEFCSIAGQVQTESQLFYRSRANFVKDVKKPAARAGLGPGSWRFRH